jgi:putative N6-adenine-specific DNA methylase
LPEFPAKTKDDIYNGAYAIEWEKLFSNKKTISVDSVVFSEIFKHSKFPGLVVKDALVDRLREKTGKRPDVNIEDPEIKINLHIADDIATISLDSSGEPLFKRGYKVATHKAPLNEITAAAIIQAFELGRH